MPLICDTDTRTSLHPDDYLALLEDKREEWQWKLHVHEVYKQMKKEGTLDKEQKLSQEEEGEAACFASKLHDLYLKLTTHIEKLSKQV